MSTIIRNPLTGLLLLAGAVGGPYALFETEVGKQAREGAASAFQSNDTPAGWLTSAPTSGGLSAEGPYWSMAGTDPAINRLNPGTEAHSLEQPPILSLREVLRFDVSPEWVMNRFPRVSTVLADMQLDGLRAPLVTGTTPTDLAGTLTYYFDHYKRLQRVTLHAVTGEPSRFVAELQQVYQLQQEPSLGGGLYLLKWNGRAASVLHVAPAPVIYGDAPYSRFNVFLELNQPGLEYGLSPAAQQLIDAGNQTQRW
ncbi:MAG: DUF6690 family protein [Pirellulaceae bacterium]